MDIDECFICLNSKISDSNKCILPCMHYMCKECYNKLVELEIKSCPFCRHPINLKKTETIPNTYNDYSINYNNPIYQENYHNSYYNLRNRNVYKRLYHIRGNHFRNLSDKDLKLYKRRMLRKNHYKNNINNYIDNYIEKS